MQLRDLLHVTRYHTVSGSLDRRITRLDYDVRRVLPGSLYFALPGPPRDGHERIALAVERGAVGVVCEHPGFCSPRSTVIRVPDARLALGQVAAAFHRYPGRRLTVIVAAGGGHRVGAAYLTRQVLQAAGVAAGLVSSIRDEIGDHVFPAPAAGRESADVQQQMARMVRAGCDACVLEEPPAAACLSEAAGVEFDLGLFVGGELDRSGGWRVGPGPGARGLPAMVSPRAKAKLGAAVFDADDHESLALRRAADARRCLTYGTSEAAHVRLLARESSFNGTRLRVSLEGAEVVGNVPLFGEEELRGLLAALAGALALGVPAALLRRRLERIGPVPGRLEGLDCGQPFGVFVDRAESERTLEKALRTLRRIATGRVLVLCGCGAREDIGERARVGEAAARLADYTVVTSNNPGREAPDAVAGSTVRGYCAVRPNDFHVELDRRRAIDELIGQAASGDTVLLAGKGHDAGEDCEDTRVTFDDREYALESLARRGFTPGPGRGRGRTS